MNEKLEEFGFKKINDVYTLTLPVFTDAEEESVIKIFYREDGDDAYLDDDGVITEGREASDEEYSAIKKWLCVDFYVTDGVISLIIDKNNLAKEVNKFIRCLLNVEKSLKILRRRR